MRNNAEVSYIKIQSDELDTTHIISSDSKVKVFETELLNTCWYISVEEEAPFAIFRPSTDYFTEGSVIYIEVDVMDLKIGVWKKGQAYMGD